MPFCLSFISFPQGYDRLLITSWGHDPGVVPTSNVLMMLNDALTHSAVLIQVQLLYLKQPILDFYFKACNLCIILLRCSRTSMKCVKLRYRESDLGFSHGLRPCAGGRSSMDFRFQPHLL